MKRSESESGWTDRDGDTEYQKSKSPQNKFLCPLACGMFEREQIGRHIMSKPGPHIAWMLQELEDCKRLLSTSHKGLVDMISLYNKATNMAAKIAGLEQLLWYSSPVETEIGRRVTKNWLPTGMADILGRDIEKATVKMENLRREMQAFIKEIEKNRKKIESMEMTIVLKNKTLEEQNLRIRELEQTSYDGTLIWKINNIRKNQAEASLGSNISIYSPAFYTSRTGYKMCARLYPNGDGMGKGTYVSLYFVVMKGHYDGLLSWPFQQRVTFVLVNQEGCQHIVDSVTPDPRSSAFKRPTSDMNVAIGCPTFVSQATLQDTNSTYVKDDVMFIKIIVDI